MPSVWRLNIKTGAEHNVDPRKFCINRGILGVGWPVEIPVNNDWDTYCHEAQRVYQKESNDNGWWPALNAIKFRMRVGDLCWTRDLDGIYFIGRVNGEWRYEETDENFSADVVNIRDCAWHVAGKVDAVPGKVVNSYFRGRTVQVVDDKSVEIYSSYLYNELSKTETYEIPSVDLDLFKLISSSDCEDLVGLFLQEKGYRLIPSSCKQNTTAYEFVLKNTATGNSAVAQVKQGDIDLIVSDYSAIPGQVFLFTTHGRYLGNADSRVSCIQPKEILDFAYSNKATVSDCIVNWMKIREMILERHRKA